MDCGKPLLQHQNAYDAVDLQQQQYQLPRLPLTPVQPLVQPPAPSTSTRRGPNSPITARELLAIAQAAVDINFFAAKHGEKGAKTKQLADKVKALGYVGSPTFFRERLDEMLIFHSDPDLAPATVRNAISASPLEPMLGAPLDLLTSQRKKFEGMSDAQRENAKKKLEQDKEGGAALRAASLNRSRRTAATAVAATATSDDEVEVVDTLTFVPRTEPVKRTEPIQRLSPPPVLDTWMPPMSILGAMEEDVRRELADAQPAPSADTALSDSTRNATAVAVVHGAAPEGGLDLDISSTTTTAAPLSPSPVSALPSPTAPESPTAPAAPATGVTPVVPETPASNVASTTRTPVPKRKSKTAKSSAKKRKTSRVHSDDSDVENTPLVKRAKPTPAKSASYEELKGLIAGGQAKTDAFHSKMLEAIEAGREQTERAIAGTQQFQGQFLDLFARMVAPK
ncbi:hypothetical protein GGX14DRAFT_570183 [Mycena pura]|uniref:Uncharacterized protein n=1 Tax=Mycena pura TaxID=153505 RepID=A0AAD6V9K9_9AGAR|nr:hypothetical protein GGX14DRAFT_570183 [Mycena pura]